MQSQSLLNRGSIQVITVTNPAAGADFTYVIPSPYNIEVQFITFTLTTDANVANRNAMIQFVEPGGWTMWRSSPIFAQLASTARVYLASQSSAANTIVYPNALQLALPPQNLLRYNWSIISAVDNIQVGDQLSAIRIAYIRHTLST